jgi:hypothetical protein
VAAIGVALVTPHPVQAKTFRCGAGDVACLIAAINDANASGRPKNTIHLEAGAYTLTTVDNTTGGPSGLPSVTSPPDDPGGWSRRDDHRAGRQRAALPPRAYCRRRRPHA